MIKTLNKRTGRYEVQVKYTPHPVRMTTYGLELAYKKLLTRQAKSEAHIEYLLMKIKNQ